MHKLTTDLEYGTIVSSGRKSITLLAEDVNFKLRRVIRKPYERIVKEGLLLHSSHALTPKEYETLHAEKTIYTENLVSWPTQFPMAKFSVRRFSNMYYLTAIDERSTDSYFLKTLQWSQINTALRDLTEGAVNLADPLILEFQNPFACYAPFQPPSWNDFEKLNSSVASSLSAALTALQTQATAGFLSPKIAALYNRLLAEVDTLYELKDFIPPLKSDFESEFENLR